MNKKEELLNYMIKNNGVILSSEATRNGFHRSTIKNLVEEKKIIQVQRGIYTMNDSYIDEFYLIAQKFKKGIFSHETALYLLGFSNRVPIETIMSFEHGTSTTRIKESGIKPIMVSNNFLVGETHINRNGFDIRVYSIERTLVDLLKSKYDADYEQLIPALKQYAVYEKRDVNKLLRIAKTFGVEKQIRNYMEVLL